MTQENTNKALEDEALQYEQKHWPYTNLVCNPNIAFKDGAEWQKTHGEGLKWVLASERLPDTVSIPVRRIGSKVVFMELVETLIRSWDLTKVEWLDESTTTNKEHQKQHIVDIVKGDEESGLYETDREIEFAEWLYINWWNMCNTNSSGKSDWVNKKTNAFAPIKQLLEQFRKQKPPVKESLTAQKEQLDKEMVEFGDWIGCNYYKLGGWSELYIAIGNKLTGETEHLNMEQILEKFKQSKQSKQ